MNFRKNVSQLYIIINIISNITDSILRPTNSQKFGMEIILSAVVAIKKEVYASHSKTNIYLREGNIDIK